MLFYKVVRGEVDKQTKQVVGNTQTVWEGTDLMELESRFPRLYFTNHNTLDQLRRIVEPKTSTVTAFMTRDNETEEWRLIEDPRFYLIREPGQRTGGRRFDPRDLPTA